MIRKSIFIVFALALTATGAQAVHLSGVEGSVLLNGNRVTENIAVAPGDRITVQSGAAKIVYENGAIVHIAPGQTAVVQANAPLPYSAPYAESSGPDIFSTDIGPAAVVAGAAGIGLAIALGSNTGDNPDSP